MTTKSTNDACDTFSNFNPPLYRQRYTKALDILTELKINTLIDFGCAELKFLNYVIAGNDVRLYSLNNIVGIDLDADLLEEFKDNIKPMGCQYLSKRFRPLEVDVFAGSISAKDKRLKKLIKSQHIDQNSNKSKSRSMITMIELI